MNSPTYHNIIRTSNKFISYHYVTKRMTGITISNISLGKLKGITIHLPFKTYIMIRRGVVTHRWIIAIQVRNKSILRWPRHWA